MARATAVGTLDAQGELDEAAAVALVIERRPPAGWRTVGRWSIPPAQVSRRHPAAPPAAAREARAAATSPPPAPRRGCDIVSSQTEDPRGPADRPVSRKVSAAEEWSARAASWYPPRAGEGLEEGWLAGARLASRAAARGRRSGAAPGPSSSNTRRTAACSHGRRGWNLVGMPR